MSLKRAALTVVLNEERLKADDEIDRLKAKNKRLRAILNAEVKCGRLNEIMRKIDERKQWISFLLSQGEPERDRKPVVTCEYEAGDDELELLAYLCDLGYFVIKRLVRDGDEDDLDLEYADGFWIIWWDKTEEQVRKLMKKGDELHCPRSL